MKRVLPARPHLEHLRAQAKALLAQLRAGDELAARTILEHLPAAADWSLEYIRTREFRLADAQLAIARKTGFAAWPFLARHVERLRGMEGTWSFVSLEVDGRTMPGGMLGASRILIDGDRFRMESPEGNYEGAFDIDVERQPHWIDIHFVEGPEAGKTCQGIFRLEGDRLTFCLGLVGAQRPERFTTSPGSGHALEELVRADATRPPGVDGGTAEVPPAPEAGTAALPEEFETASGPTLERLQGDWVALELITSGTPLPQAYLAFGGRTQAGAETKVVFGGQTMVHALVRFHEAVSPIAVDYLSLEGPSKGMVSRGLFRWDGEEAVFCMAPPGSPRPLDFGCEQDSGRTFSRWRRKA